MNRPSFSTRMAGSPLGAIVLFAACGFVGWAWHEGSLTRWWLFIAAVTSMRTLGSIRRVRHYKRWLADWQAMGAGQGAPPMRRKKRRSLIFASALAIVLPFAAQQVKDNAAIPNGPAVVDGLIWAWLIACLYLGGRFVWKLLRQVRRGVGLITERQRAKAELAPVRLLVPRPSSSPSRADADANLPEYCDGLI
jgi:hypothetical protein